MRPGAAIEVSTVAGVVVGAFTVSVQIPVRSTRLDRARQGVVARIRELTAEFPEFLASWGGAAVFRNPDAVGEAVRGLESAPRWTTASGPGAERTCVTFP
jgi:hypothetical protein